MYIKEKPKKPPKNISFVLFIYWIAVILWQTFRPVLNRSMLDTLVKIGLFLAVVIYSYFNRKTKFNVAFVSLFLVFIATQLCTFYFDSGTTLSLSNLITVAFMFAQIFVFFGWNFGAVIHTDNLVWYCRWLCRIVTVMCLYNMIFMWDRFSTVFSLSSGAYGSECHSFLYSNHEFALYTATAFIALIWLFISKRIKVLSAVSLFLLYSVNLLSTYSRTALLGVFGALLIVLFFYKKRIFVWTVSISVAVLTFIMANPFLYTLVFEKIFKGSFTGEGALDKGREAMYEFEWQAFLRGGNIQKLFGYGHAGADQFGGHDAYLTILLTGGIVMFLWFVLMIFVGFRASYKCLKRDKGIGSLMFGFQTMALLYMVAQTPILFYSSMDSFFITSIAVLIPFYVANNYKFENKVKEAS